MHATLTGELASKVEERAELTGQAGPDGIPVRGSLTEGDGR